HPRPFGPAGAGPRATGSARGPSAGDPVSSEPDALPLLVACDAVAAPGGRWVIVVAIQIAPDGVVADVSAPVVILEDQVPPTVTGPHSPIPSFGATGPQSSFVVDAAQGMILSRFASGHRMRSAGRLDSRQSWCCRSGWDRSSCG